MLNKVIIALGLLLGSFLAAWGASSTLSGLSAGGAISGTDLFYDVQTVGVGGVKVTGTQFLNFVFGNVSGNCSANPTGVFSCVGGNSTGIGAGTNITTSGTGNNVTINVVATPTFTSITTTLASVTGWLTAAGVNMQTTTIAGAASVGGSLTVTGNLTGSTGNFTSNLTANIAQVPGFLTASGASVQTLTINSITGLTQCVQASSTGVISGSNSACSSSSASIAAGSNITTSGTPSNVTVAVVPSPTFGAMTVTTVAAFPGFLTASGAAHQTATVAGNLTATTAAFPGFLTASGVNMQTATIASISGSTQCVQASSAGVLSGTASPCGGSGSTPGGINTAVQFNFLTGTFTGDPGFTFTTPAALVLSSGIVAANTKSLTINQTWNSSGRLFDAPLFMGITNTASAANSKFIDVQKDGSAYWGLAVGTGGPVMVFTNQGAITLFNNQDFLVGFAPDPLANGSWARFARNVGIVNNANGMFGWTNSTTDASNMQTITTEIYQEQGFNDTLVLSRVANPQALRIYNSSNGSAGTAPTTYERGIVDWATTTNQFTIGTQAGGTGVGRTMAFVASNTIAMSISPTINLYGQSNPGANETYAVCAGSGATSLTSGGQLFVDTTACLASSMMVKHDIAAFNDYGMTRLASLAQPLHAEGRLADRPINVDPIAELMSLVPAVATYDSLEPNSPQFTLIAQNVCQVDERLCERTRDGEIRAFRPNAVISLLVATVQKQQSEIEELKRRLH